MTQAKKTLVAYKAFNADWKCNGFQFEVGKTYVHDGEVEMCKSGFHACTVPFDCWRYYEHSTTFARVELSGVSDTRQEDSKLVAASITISASLSLPEWIKAQVEAVTALCKAATGKLVGGTEECAAATGYYGHAAATGNCGHAAATGNCGHAAATGDRGHAAATGNCGHAAVKGRNAIAAALGINSTATAESGGAIVLAAYDDDYNLVAVRAALVGSDGVEAGKTYRLTTAGEFEEAP